MNHRHISPDPDPDLDMDLNLDPHPKPELEPELDLELDWELDLVSELEPDWEPELDLEPELELDLEPDLELELDLGWKLDLGPELEPYWELDLEPNLELELVLEPEMEPDLELDLTLIQLGGTWEGGIQLGRIQLFGFGQDSVRWNSVNIWSRFSWDSSYIANNIDPTSASVTLALIPALNFLVPLPCHPPPPPTHTQGSKVRRKRKWGGSMQPASLGSGWDYSRNLQFVTFGYHIPIV